ncbi:TIGR04141 family sporadically distributed protein [Streptomyces griseoaurantiacus]|uniref:TIGR04141 family sporadically distributed protein n=1 Tax=Streptomyces griseoaurantiacus TaxID=68213 RepID=UPI003682413E
MRVSIYLFRAKANSFEGLLRDFPEGSRAPQKRDLKDGVDLDCEIWALPAEPRAPKWATALSKLTPISDLKNSNNSVAVLFKVRDRYFAVCFGYAHAMLNHELIEPEFGLRVTANMADPFKVAAIQVRTLSENSRQQRSQTASRTRVAEFDVEVEREWLRYLKADVSDGVSWASGVAGSQSLSLTTQMELLQFPTLLSHLLEQFTSEAYKEKFPYIDNFVPISAGDPILDDLWSALREAILSPQGKKLGVACPDDLLGAEVGYWKIFGDRKRNREPIEELDLESVLAQIPANDLEEKLPKLKIIPIDESDNPMRTKRSLTDYFVFEQSVDGETYALCLGQWFKIASDYVQEINSEIAKIEDVTEAIKLPDWLPGADGKHGDEGEYNDKVSTLRGYIPLDARNFLIGGPHQKVEICDFITPDTDFVCVKRMEGSPTLSHLFSQAAVSADLYAANAVGQGKHAVGYADYIKDLISSKWGLSDAEVDRNKRMVLAIATEKAGKISDLLYFFSKVNLVQRVSDLRKSGFRVALAKIYRPEDLSGN